MVKKINKCIQRSVKTLLFFFLLTQLSAQEGLKPLSGNLNYFYSDLTLRQANEKPEPTAQKAASLFLPFLDDFHYADRAQYPSMKFWQDSTVFVNSGFPKAPPSIGVATFDGLDKNGYPYDANANPNLNNSKPADTLTSRAINLKTTSNSQTLTPADNIGLTFYYQARGNGEPPELLDSLILDLYKPLTNQWKSAVWSVRGSNNPNLNDSNFKRVFIWLRDTSYFHDGFKFRFRNKATTSGNFDHWHLDFVYINNNRDSLADTLYNDVTFGHVPTSFLTNYYAMPWQQYKASEMSKSNSVLLKNNFKDPVNIYYENHFYNLQNTSIDLFTYNAQANNIPPFRTNGYWSNPAYRNPAAQLSFTFTYPLPMTDSTDFLIKHFIYRNGPNIDFIPLNDTVYQYQRFRNYYAIDDGSAEAGYYVIGQAAQMAVRFTVNYTDTLRAVRIYFDPAPLGSTSKFNFKVKLYDGITSPGNLLYTSDTMYPRFLKNGYKMLPEYKLKVPQVLPPGTYFIAIEQQLSTGLVVGFDRNTEGKGNVHYKSGPSWAASGEKGALMIRPVFGKQIPSPVGIKELQVINAKITVYPNPASDFIYIMNDSEYALRYELRNALGQIVATDACQTQQSELNTSSLSSGLYFLSIYSGDLSLRQHKIIISH